MRSPGAPCATGRPSRCTSGRWPAVRGGEQISIASAPTRRARVAGTKQGASNAPARPSRETVAGDRSAREWPACCAGASDRSGQRRHARRRNRADRERPAEIPGAEASRNRAAAAAARMEAAARGTASSGGAVGQGGSVVTGSGGSTALRGKRRGDAGIGRLERHRRTASGDGPAAKPRAARREQVAAAGRRQRRQAARGRAGRPAKAAPPARAGPGSPAARARPGRATSTSPPTRPASRPTARFARSTEPTAAPSTRSGARRTRPPRTSRF